MKVAAWSLGSSPWEVSSEGIWGKSCLECGADLTDYADPDDPDRCTQCGPGQAIAS